MWTLLILFCFFEKNWTLACSKSESYLTWTFRLVNIFLKIILSFVQKIRTKIFKVFFFKSGGWNILLYRYILLQVKACFRIRFTNLGEDFANSTQLSSSKIVVIPMTEPRLLPKSVVIDLQPCTIAGISKFKPKIWAIFPF